MRPPPLAIRDRRRVEQRVAAALHEMLWRQYRSVEVIAAHPQMKRPAVERASLDFMLRRRSHHLSRGFSPNLRPFSDTVAARGTFAAATICLARTIAGTSMNEDHLKPVIRGPLVIALAIAVFGVLAMLIVDHGPWSRPLRGLLRRRSNLLKHNNLMLKCERRERLEAWAASDSPISHSQY